MKETVLVSGGAGYIGTHTAVALIEAGYDVVIIDNFSNSEPAAVEGVEKIVGRKVCLEEVDTCDKEALRGVFERHQFNTVIHFAAYKAVGESMSEPLKYYQNNLVSYGGFWIKADSLMCIISAQYHISEKAIKPRNQEGCFRKFQ